MQDLKKLLRTTDRYIAILNVNGIFSLKDLLNYFPKTHEDRLLIQDSFQVQESLEDPKQKQRVRVFVTEKKIMMLRNKKKIYDVRFHDEFGVEGKASYRGTGFAFQQIQKEMRYIVIGKPKMVKNKAVFSNPEFILSAAPSENMIESDYVSPTSTLETIQENAVVEE